ncbi:hypothetical protein OE88DRAFT_1640693 [Heliocybe sulcata]|uniref:Uncharacterized protein n=1 Tax=Heliocybe sulcata TaxID=5364 RepID=A0A5C3NG56_9AGAM|nr:hypothetical protein OE88DRAFT_1640693 [Heliocybe sulcata]
MPRYLTFARWTGHRAGHSGRPSWAYGALVCSAKDSADSPLISGAGEEQALENAASGVAAWPVGTRGYRKSKSSISKSSISIAQHTEDSERLLPSARQTESTYARPFYTDQNADGLAASSYCIPRKLCKAATPLIISIQYLCPPSLIKPSSAWDREVRSPAQVDDVLPSETDIDRWMTVHCDVTVRTRKVTPQGLVLPNEIRWREGGSGARHVQTSERDRRGRERQYRASVIRFKYCRCQAIRQSVPYLSTYPGGRGDVERSRCTVPRSLRPSHGPVRRTADWLLEDDGEDATQSWLGQSHWAVDGFVGDGEGARTREQHWQMTTAY